jgi:hypothetical protein
MRNRFPKLLICSFFTLASNYSYAQLPTCDNNLRLLNSDLVSMLNKISAMPPVAQIYRPVRDLYEAAKSAKNRGDYSECVSKTELALKYSKPYGNRQ